MKVYVVHRVLRSYARDDAMESDVVGAYTDKEIARKVALISHGRYEEMEVDYVFPGIKAAASEFGFSL